MSEILGYDIDGKPLRAGDRVVYAGSSEMVVAMKGVGPWTVKGPDREGEVGFVDILEKDSAGIEWGIMTAVVRRIDDRTDHQPSQESFEALMSRLKSGDIVSRPEGVVA